jgi:uncharacterized protein YjbI with pentapeptide repeats
MVNEEHVALLKQGVAAWNAWRRENYNIPVDLRGASFSGESLSKALLFGARLNEANLSRANLSKANLKEADLSRANLVGVDLTQANLNGALLLRTDLSGANLNKANLSRAWAFGANLVGADLTEANLSGAMLNAADLSTADLHGGFLVGANLSRANLSNANLRGADLKTVTLVNTNLTGADLTGCRVFGLSAWGLKVDRTKQQNLVITSEGEPEITVDNIEVAQFVYLLLHNQKIRDVIDTITSKAVLILGRFTGERKAVLDALRDELRNRGYLPILFDFDQPASRDITETVSLLARMARFIIADLTDPSSIPKELEAIVPHLAVPVQSLIQEPARPFAMFKDLLKYEWMLKPYRYESLDRLLASLADEVIAPAEAKVKALEEKRRQIEAELINPQ